MTLGPMDFRGPLVMRSLTTSACVRISVKTFFFEITYFRAKKTFEFELALGPCSVLGAPSHVPTITAAHVLLHDQALLCDGLSILVN